MLTDADLIKTHVARVEVQPQRLVVELTPLQDLQTGETTAERTTVHIPWQKPPSKRRREIVPRTRQHAKMLVPSAPMRVRAWRAVQIGPVSDRHSC